MKQLLKKGILACLSHLGILKLLHFTNRHAITVLMVHGVMAKHQDVKWEPLRPQLSPDEFSRVLAIIANYYHFITIKECVDMLSGKTPLIDNALLITFDDGYRNNIDYALPICERFAIKPVLFIATSHIDSGLPFWFDRLDYALQQNMGELISLSYQDKHYHFDATSREALILSFKKFRDDCKHQFSDDIKMNQLFTALSNMLESRSGKALADICINDDWSAMVSWEQLRELVAVGRLDVASHTMDHWRVDSLSQEMLSNQLQQSKVTIEKKLTIKCDYFCYPNGNYNQQAINLIKETGYLAAFSTDVGLCRVKDDLMTLKRFNFPANKTVAEILYQLNS